MIQQDLIALINNLYMYPNDMDDADASLYKCGYNIGVAQGLSIVPHTAMVMNAHIPYNDEGYEMLHRCLETVYKDTKRYGVSPVTSETGRIDALEQVGRVIDIYYSEEV